MNAIEENKLQQQYFEEVGKANATPAGFSEWLMSKKPKELAVWESLCPEWVIAYDPDDANKVAMEAMDYDMEDLEGEEWKKLDPDKEFRFLLDERDLPPGFHEYMIKKGRPENYRIIIAASCADWIKARGRGFLATTNL